MILQANLGSPEPLIDWREKNLERKLAGFYPLVVSREIWNNSRSKTVILPWAMGASQHRRKWPQIRWACRMCAPPKLKKQDHAGGFWRSRKCAKPYLLHGSSGDFSVLLGFKLLHFSLLRRPSATVGLSFLAEGHHPIWDLNDTVYKALSRQNMSKLLSTLYETNQWLPPQPCFPEKHCYFDKVLFDVVKTNTNTPSSGSRLACAVIPNWSSTNQTAPKDLYSWVHMITNPKKNKR